MALSIIINKILQSSSETSSSDSDDLEDYIICKKFKLNSSDTEIPEIIPKPKIRIEHPLLDSFYNLSDFKTHFCLSKTSVERIVYDIEKKKIVTPGHPSISTRNALLICLWTLSHLESLKSIADRFGVVKSLVHRLTLKICHLLVSKIHKYISWPDVTEAESSIETFNQLRDEDSFPRVVGCIDITFINISKRITSDTFGEDRNNSVILQAVCNSKLQFIDVFCGLPESPNSVVVWENSSLKNAFEDGEISLPDNSYLLGNLAYPLKPYLMVPFIDNGSLSPEQMNFNRKLKNTYICIRQCFKKLKDTFQRLEWLNVYKVRNIKYFILASCIFYNIVMEELDYFFIEEDLESENDNVIYYEEDYDKEAFDIRNKLTESFK